MFGSGGAGRFIRTCGMLLAAAAAAGGIIGCAGPRSGGSGGNGGGGVAVGGGGNGSRNGSNGGPNGGRSGGQNGGQNGGANGGHRPVAGLSNARGKVELEARWERDEQKVRSAGSSRTAKATETIFRESVGLGTDGYVYHPNLVEFSVDGLFSLQQYEVDWDTPQDSGRQHDRSTLFQYDIAADFLKKKSYPLHAFAYEHQAWEPRTFGASVDRTTQGYGGRWRFVDSRTPIDAQYSHTRLDRHYRRADARDERYVDDVLRVDSSYICTDRNEFNLVYEHASFERDPSNVDYDQDEVVGTHRLNFGELAESRLHSRARGFFQRGDFDTDWWTLTESLWLKHTDTLSTNYELELLDREQRQFEGAPRVEERSVYFKGGLAHQLYQSLDTTLDGQVQNQDFKDGVDVCRRNGRAGLAYRKINPYGLLRLNYGLFLERLKLTGGDGIIPIVDEPHTFQDPRPVQLDNPAIVPGTIFVTDLTGSVIYREGPDYTVRESGNRVELTRVPTGRILNGQAVLVDYEYAIGTDQTVSTTGHRFEFRHEFDLGFTPYYVFDYLDQDVSSADENAGVGLEDYTSHLFGLEYQKDRLDFRAEYENYNGSEFPFDAVRAGGSYRHEFSFHAVGTVVGGWEQTSYDAEDRDVTYVFARGTYEQDITETVSARMVGEYQRRRDTVDADDEGFYVNSTLEWGFGKTTVRVTGEFRRFRGQDTRTDDASVYFEFVREF